MSLQAALICLSNCYSARGRGETSQTTPCPLCATLCPHLVSERREGGRKGERAGHHGGSQAQHGHSTQRQRGGDNAGNGCQEDGQQVPGVGGHACGRRREPQRRAQAHADGQLLQVGAPLDACDGGSVRQREGAGGRGWSQGRVGLRRGRRAVAAVRPCSRAARRMGLTLRGGGGGRRGGGLRPHIDGASRQLRDARARSGTAQGRSQAGAAHDLRDGPPLGRLQPRRRAGSSCAQTHEARHLCSALSRSESDP